jgi:predicted ATPase/DNA-binding SARP family transcriptional activator/DNA-binding CsgD family transcriptional regulator
MFGAAGGISVRSSPLISPTETQGLQIRLLDSPQIAINGHIIQEQAWQPMAKGLVLFLAFQPGYRCHRDKIIEAFWPEMPEEKGRNNLHQVVRKARKTFEATLGQPAASAYLRWPDDVLILAAPEDIWVDVTEFQAACKTAQRTKDPRDYEAALALYQGELLPHDGYSAWEDWVYMRRKDLRALYLNLLYELAQLYRARGEVALLIDALRKIVKVEEFPDAALRELLLLYARSGQRHHAIHHYQQVKKRLWEESEAPLEAETTALFQDVWNKQIAIDPRLVVHMEITTPAPAPIVQRDVQRTNLPARSDSFIGRQQELEQIQAALAAHRLVTLAGPPGCGKTRLAEQSADMLLDTYADGVWFVDLAPLRDGTRVAQTVADVFGIPEQSNLAPTKALTQALGEKHLLLILDNCEHLPNACAKLSTALLAACPRLSILATSRQALHLPEEYLWKTGSLSTPDPGNLPPFKSLLDYDAIQLFRERASTASQPFTITPMNSPDIVRICHRLDGSPLAIELAVGRLHSIGLDQMARHLDDVLPLLKTGNRSVAERQQTLNANLDWSYALLTPPQQMLLRRLAVFVGGWTADQAEQVCGWQPLEARDVLPLLDDLIDQNLVVREKHDEQVRYRFLEMVRQYSVRKCLEAGERDAQRQRHAACYLQLAEEAEPALRGPEQALWWTRLEYEHNNLRATLHWSLEQPAEEATGVRLTGAVWRFWQHRGHMVEGQRWLKRTLEHHRAGSPAAQAARARALIGAGALTYLLGKTPQAIAFYEEALSLSRSLDDPVGMISALNNLGMIFQYQGKQEQALKHFRDSLTRCRRIDDTWRLGVTLNNLSTLLKDQGNFHEALPLAEECLAVFRQLEDHLHVAGMLNNLGTVLLALGDFARATAAFEGSLAYFRSQQNPMGTIDILQSLAAAAQRQGKYPQALPLLEEALELSREQQDEWGQAIEFCLFGLCYYGQGNTQRAWDCYQQSLVFSRKLEYHQCIAPALVGLGTIRTTQGAYQEATALYQEALRALQKVTDRATLAAALEGRAGLAVAEGQHHHAARLFGAAARIRDDTGAILYPCDRPAYEQQCVQGRAALGDVIWGQEWTAWQALPDKRLIAAALAPEDDGALAALARARGGKPAHPLTTREQEIAQLVAQRLTDAQIAVRLSCSPRTAEKHVQNIRNKLGLQTREQIATWARERGLLDSA